MQKPAKGFIAFYTSLLIFLSLKKITMSSLKIFKAIVPAAFFLCFACKKDINNANKSDLATQTTSTARAAITYTYPDENMPHEGTWLQWPHQYTYGTNYRNRLEPTWVAMTKELTQVEKVHIIAYNNTEKNRIVTQLQNAGVNMAKVDYKIMQTNDCWVRDNGPVFVRNSSGQLRIEDWGFNGWGNKTSYRKDDVIPTSVGNATGMQVVNLNTSMIFEGGAMTIDGNGTFMATKTSVLNSNRNPGLSQAQAESILTQNLGVSKFIWLNGTVSQDDITDMHIDGFAMFANASTIVTMDSLSLNYWYLSASDITKLYSATNINGVHYNYVYLPLTQNNVVTAYGKNLGYKGSYVNYYVSNSKVLVPIYSDPNDQVAINMLKTVYPGKSVVGIDCRNLYEQGGMVHCVTQQQPL